MTLNLTPIKAMIDEGLPSSPPAAPRSNSAESVRNFLKAFVDALAAQNYTPDHEWNGTQLRFTRADGQPGPFVDLRGAQGAAGPKGDPGSLSASSLPTRTTPVNRDQDLVVVQRGDGTLEKVNLYQLAGGSPLVTGNLVANGNGEFGDLSNLLPNNPARLSFDPVQVSVAGGRGAFKWTGAPGSLMTVDKISVNLLRRIRIAVVARTGDASGANYDPNARAYLGLQCLDADGLSISPVHFAKVAGAALTTLAAPLKPGDTTLTLTSAAGWHNGSTAAWRQLAWYPYVNALGQQFPDYGYSRNVTSGQYPAGAWAQGGIAGNVVTLTSAWAGPTLATGTKVANVTEGGTFMYSSVLNNAHVPNAWTAYECFVQGVNAGTAEDSSNLQFRPGTAFIKPLLLINYNNPASGTTFYLSMLDVREVTGTDPATLLAGDNTFTGANSFAGDVSVRRLVAMGNPPSVAGGSGAGSGATLSMLAGSTDMAGTLQITAAANAQSNVPIATVTFATALAAAPKVVLLTARNGQTAMSLSRFFVDSKSATGWVLSSTDVSLANGVTYLLDYLVIV